MKLGSILRGLTLRIYLVSLAQLGAVAACLMLVHWLTFDPSRNPHFKAEALLSAKLVEEAVKREGSARREGLRIHALLGGQISVYDEHDQLLESNAPPGLPPLAAAERARVLAGEELLAETVPPVISVPVKIPGKRAYLRFKPRRGPKPPAFLMQFAVFALVAGGVGAVLLARSLTMPLRTLSSTAQKLGEGDLQARAALTRRDEFGEVSDAFDDMAERLGDLLRAQQELIANVSHELRTPLARIRVALDIAAEGDSQTAQETLVDITDDLAELERLVSDVLQSARLDLAQGRARAALPAVRKEPVALGRLLEKSVQRFHQAEPTRTLVVQVPAELPEVVGDSMLLRRAVDNLLDNAAAYSDAATPITLSARDSDSELVIQVIDQGIGIAAEHIPLLTRPFFRADPSRTRKTGGYGLGLSLCARIAASHGGRLGVESQLGLGTTMTLHLPLSPARTPA
jgi:two-component system, OmpR family, sensor kinase